MPGEGHGMHPARRDFLQSIDIEYLF